jgi:lipoprotein-anchoring transpeptidase ErfK/SrfK
VAPSDGAGTCRTGLNLRIDFLLQSIIGGYPRTNAIVSLAAALSIGTAAFGGPLGYASSDRSHLINDQDRGANEQEPAEVPAQLRRQVVAYKTREAPGTIVIDTPNTQLYYVLGTGKAIRYGIGVGREGFTWSGVQTISRKTEWPDCQTKGAVVKAGQPAEYAGREALAVR